MIYYALVTPTGEEDGKTHQRLVKGLDLKVDESRKDVEEVLASLEQLAKDTSVKISDAHILVLVQVLLFHISNLIS